jgi:hypothetical protein
MKRWIPVLALLASCAPPEDATLFQERALASGIDFRNDLEENEDQNIVDYLYFYNGAGVAVADFNKDGLEDIYFVRNQGPNALYWNQGNWSFTEGAGPAGVQGQADFQTGVSITDLNSDGYPDIHLSSVAYLNWKGHNEFYLNNGDGTFKEISSALGIDLVGYGQQALFFDADNDGDQDLYVLRHSVHPSGAFNNASQRSVRDEKAGDVFFLNTGTPTQPKFEDKSEDWGILGSQIGYGLSIVSDDFNGDGYLDLFVGNDFHENDYLYLNQQGKGFLLATEQSFRTNSKFTMGADAADLDHNGLPDLFTLDMKPWDEVERKNALGAEPFPIHKYKRGQGYVEQFPKNSLHLNAGVIPTRSANIPVFEDAAPYFGVESTDWSWGVLAEDFDGNGSKDLFITNGIKRRPNDLDYIQFLSNGGGGAALDEQIYSKMPPGKVSNRAFSGTSDPTAISFEECSKKWGVDYVGTSNGSAYGDFNNDGRWDLVVNNLDGPALLYENVLGTPSTLVDFGGYHVSYKKRSGALPHWNTGTRGWLSSSSTRRMADDFGGAILVQWPTGLTESFVLLPGELNSLVPGQGTSMGVKDTSLTTKHATTVPDTLPLVHKEDAYTSFVQTPLMLEGVDEMGPAGAVFQGSVFVGGSFRNAPSWASKTQGAWTVTTLDSDAEYEDTDAQTITLGNGAEALVVVTGSSQLPNESFRQRDRIYFAKNTSGRELSDFGTNASSVAVLDMNGDGIEDVFIGERSVWNDYGAAPAHAQYLGSADGTLTYSVPEWAQSIGMITDALAIDLNGDHAKELVLSTDWGPIYKVSFSGGSPVISQIAHNSLWRHLNAVDIDGDGDMDLLAGAVGGNLGISFDPDHPLELWIKDLDNNGDRDFLYSYVNQGERYPLFGRDELIKESVKYRKSYLINREYSGKAFDRMFEAEISGAQHLSVGITESGMLINEQGRFEFKPLPMRAQLGPITASLSVNGGIKIAGGADDFHTSIGTQESFCGGTLVYKDGSLEIVAPQELLRGSVASLLWGFDKEQIIVLMNDGAALELSK